MVEHLVNRSFHRFGIQRKYSEHDQSHMADARVGDKGFHVLLDQGHQASVDDPYQAEHGE